MDTERLKRRRADDERKAPRGTGTTVRGREPVGAQLRVGKSIHRKTARGQMAASANRDRFYICMPRAGGDGLKALHPAFSWWNAVAEKAPEKCRHMAANLTHVLIDDAFDAHRHCHKNPRGESPPNRRPWCMGNGIRAVRTNAAGESEEIVCPGDACPFAQSSDCKPQATLLFQYRPGRELPDGAAPLRPLMKFVTRAQYNSYPNLLEFFRYLAEQVIGLGLAAGELDESPEAGYRFLSEHRVPLYGLPFSMTLSDRTSNTEGGRRFPVVDFTADGNLQEFFARQAELRRELEAGKEALALTEGVRDLTEEEMQEDCIDLEPGSIPAKQGGLFE